MTKPLRPTLTLATLAMLTLPVSCDNSSDPVGPGEPGPSGWTQQEILPAEHPDLHAIAARGEDGFVTVGSRHYRAQYSEQEGWRPSGEGVGTIRAVGPVGDHIVFATDSGDIYSTADRLVFRAEFGNDVWHQIASNGETLVVVGDAGHVVTTTDGREYESEVLDTSAALLSATVLDDGFLIGDSDGYLWTYGDGWRRSGFRLASGIRSLAVSRDVVYAVSTEGSIHRLESRNWRKVWSSPTHHAIDIEASDLGVHATATRGLILLSADGSWWASRQLPTNYDLNAIAAGHGLMHAAGNAGALFQSADGRSWTRIPLPRIRDLDEMVRFQDQYVLIGTGDAPVLLSDDGKHWRRGVDRDSRPSGFYAVATDGETIVATGGQGDIWTSTDPHFWELVTDQKNQDLYPYCLDWTGSQFVLAGSPEYMLRSPDGRNWTPVEVPPGIDFYDSILVDGTLHFATPEGIYALRGDALELVSTAELFKLVKWGQRFVGIELSYSGSLEESRTALVSDDLQTWQRYALPAAFRSVLSLSEHEGTLVVTGPEGALAMSDDAMKWTVQPTGTFANLRGAKRVPDGWVVFGDRGTVLTDW